MSVLFCDNDCILISHQLFIDNIYENNEYPLDLDRKLNKYKCCFKCNPLLFDINSVYKRKNHNLSSSINKIKCDKKTKRRYSCVETINNFAEKLIEIIKLKTTEFMDICLKNGNIIKKDTISIANGTTNEAAQNFTQSLFSTQNVPCILKGKNDLDLSVITEIQNKKYLIPSKCVFHQNYIENLEKITTDLYDFVIIDPPWSNKFIKRARHALSENSYHSLDDSIILNLPIENLTKPNSIVVIWCTNSPSHIDSIKTKFLPKWNLKLLSIWYWVKITKYGETVCPFDLPLKKQPFEQIFIACHEASDLQEMNEHMKQIKYIFSIPSAIHSHKPPLIDLFREFLPAQPKALELFARYLLPGFTSIGLEVLKLQNLELYIEGN